MAPEQWQPSSEDLMSVIEQESRRHRSNCWAFIEEFAEMYAVELSPQELDDAWVDLVNNYPWYAEDLLHCLREILADRLRSLPEIIVELVELEAENVEVGDRSSGLSRQESARRWLHTLYERFDAVFEELSGPPPLRRGLPQRDE